MYGDSDCPREGCKEEVFSEGEDSYGETIEKYYSCSCGAEWTELYEYVEQRDIKIPEEEEGEGGASTNAGN